MRLSGSQSLFASKTYGLFNKRQEPLTTWEKLSLAATTDDDAEDYDNEDDAVDDDDGGQWCWWCL